MQRLYLSNLTHLLDIWSAYDAQRVLSGQPVADASIRNAIVQPLVDFCAGLAGNGQPLSASESGPTARTWREVCRVMPLLARNCTSAQLHTVARVIMSTLAVGQTSIGSPDMADTTFLLLKNADFLEVLDIYEPLIDHCIPLCQQVK